MENKIKAQEEKIQDLRRTWLIASPSYKRLIESVALIEKDKLEKMKDKYREEVDKNAPDSLF